MKKSFILFLLFSLSILTGSAEEISLFDRDGNAIAYIDTDDDLTIYMWNGTPVAYLEASRRSGYDVYGFNGKHLGWFEKGIMRDHDGYIVGFQKNALYNYTRYEPYKSYKKYKPYKSYQEYAPYRPYDSSRFSTESLSLFLMRGKK